MRSVVSEEHRPLVKVCYQPQCHNSILGVMQNILPDKYHNIDNNNNNNNKDNDILSNNNNNIVFWVHCNAKYTH